VPSHRTYATAGAFRRALEERIRKVSVADQIDLNRLRRQISFDRLLARLFQKEPAPWVLKGGYALELRFDTARSTVDIDLTLRNVPDTKRGDTNERIRGLLQRAAGIDLGDWFEFVIGPPIMDLNAAPYVAPDIRSRRGWTPGSLRDSIWMRVSATWSWSRLSPGCAVTGWDLRASKRLEYG